MQNSRKKSKMVSLLGIYILLFFVVQKISAATIYGPCMLSGRTSESCVKITDCVSFYKILTQGTLTESQRSYIRGSRCGQDGSDVLVCCPDAIQPNQGYNNGLALLPKSPQCGRDLSNRIVGGNVTTIDEFPWMVLLEYVRGNGRRGHFCGGVLINENYVLTAAHCLTSDRYRLIRVRLGEWDKTTNPDCEVTFQKTDCAPEHVDVNVEKEIPHPDYNPSNINVWNDIALLRLANKVKITDFVKPICLPLDDALRNSNFVNLAMDIAGFGDTEEKVASTKKLKAVVQVVDSANCRSKYSQYGRKISDSQICAGGVKGIDTCTGDSGGPLMFFDQNDNTFFVAGVVSFGPEDCGTENWPGVYTRVGAYTSWIADNIRP